MERSDDPAGDEAADEHDGSLAPEPEEDEPALAGGSLSEWRRQREAARRRRESEERRREEAEVDRLLRKISAQGEPSLTSAERRTLRRAAARLRQSPPEDSLRPE